MAATLLNGSTRLLNDNNLPVAGRTFLDTDGNHLASDATNWSPTGTPIAGDTLIIHSGEMAIVGDDLKGDLLTEGTANKISTTKFDLSSQASLNLQTAPGSNDKIYITSNGGDNHVNLHASGATTLSLYAQTGDLSTDIFDLTLCQLDVYGTFDNTGTIGLHGSYGFIHGSLGGTGSINLNTSGHGSILEFGGSVSKGQTIGISSSDSHSTDVSYITIDNPAAFGATVDLKDGYIDLKNLTADSYSFKNGMLNLFSHGKAVDTINLHASTDHLSVLSTSIGIVVDNSGSSFSDAFILQKLG